jgi:hypothetical protein
VAIVAGCAKRPENIQPKFASATPYRALSCEQLNEERSRLNAELARIETMQRENANTDAVFMTVGVHDGRSRTLLARPVRPCRNDGPQRDDRGDEG